LWLENKLLGKNKEALTYYACKYLSVKLPLMLDLYVQKQNHIKCSLGKLFLLLKYDIFDAKAIKENLHEW